MNPAPEETTTRGDAAAASTGGRTRPRRVIATADGLHEPGGGDPWCAGRRVTAVAAGDGGDPWCAGRRVTAVAAGDGDDLWALVDDREVHRVGTGDAVPVATLETGSATSVHVHRGIVYVGGDEAALWRLDGDRLEPVSSFADAPTRPDWHTPWGGPPSVLSMDSSDDDLYVNVHVGGVLRSNDGGRSWLPTIDLHADVHQIVVDPRRGRLWAATGTDGLAVSADRGRTWTHHREGLHGTYLLTAAASAAGVLVGASSGHAATDGAVYLFADERFEPVAGVPDDLRGAVGPRRLAASGRSALLATPHHGVFTSDDGGRSWAPMTVPDLGAVNEVVVAA